MDDDHEDENDPSNGIIAQSLPPAPVPNGVSDRQLPPAAASLSSLNRSQHQSMRPMFEVIAPHGVIVREKIETDPSNPDYIVTEPGIGYRMEEFSDDESDAALAQVAGS